MKNASKLCKTIEEYEKSINELRNERGILSRENKSLKEIIVKLEHSKLNNNDSSRNMNIYLGKRLNDDSQLEKQNLLSITPQTDYTDREPKYGASNAFFVNPLFHTKSSENEKIDRTSSSHTAELKLKQKLSVYLNNKKGPKSHYPDPSFYIKETKNFHNTTSFPLQQQRELHYLKEPLEIDDMQSQNLSFNIKRSLKTIKKSPLIAQCVKSTSQHNMRTSITSVQSSSSETSLVSCLSHPITEIADLSQIDDNSIPPRTENHNRKVNNSKSAIILRHQLLGILYVAIVFLCLIFVIALAVL